MAPCRSRVGMKELFSTGSGILGRSFDIGDFPPRLRLREFLASALPVTKRQDGDHMRYSRKRTYHKTRNSWRFNYDNFVYILRWGTCYDWLVCLAVVQFSDKKTRSKLIRQAKEDQH